MRVFYIFLLSITLVNCGLIKDYPVEEWIEEQESRSENGVPVKCPHCYKGWGFVLDNESNEDPIYCSWKGPKMSHVKLDGDANYKFIHEVMMGDISDEIKERKKLQYELWQNQIVRQTSETVDMAIRRLSEGFLRERVNLDHCFAAFTYNQSLDEYEKYEYKKESHRLSLREGERVRQEIEAAKSPEQRELEKLNREVKALKEEVKKQNNKVPRRRIFP